MNRRSRCLQHTAERVVIGKLQMIRFGVGVRGGVNGLEIRFRNRGFVSRKSATAGSAAGGKQDRADCAERDEAKKAELFQGQAESY